MATYWNQRCSLCGQFVAASDREEMLEATRWEWDERLVDEALVDRHLCVDRDPYGARESERLIEAGEMVPELRWLLQVALERKQAAGRPAWAAFASPAASSARVLVFVADMACCRPASGSLRAAGVQVHDCLPADGTGRSPPWRACPVPSLAIASLR